MNKYLFLVLISTITLLSLASQISYAQYQPPTYPTSLINPTYQVGTLPGSLGISSRGSATYTIPLTVPPGTAGMTPSLSISYNSHHRNGILGMGWNLNGLSEITRVPLSYYFDGTAQSVELTLNDAFALDSMRLILVSGTHGMDGAEYATEIESFNKIIAHGTAGNGPAWFEVKTKNGTTIEYGNSDFSKVEPLGSVTPYRWRVNKITDQNGNYMTFQYNEESGESTITSIIYTGNTSSGLTPYNTIEFNYLFRDSNYDPSFQYVGGGKVSQVKLLTSINVKTNGGSTLVSTYTFKYHYDFYTHLNEVYQTGSDGTRINSTIFGWGLASAMIQNSNLTNGSKLKYFHGDFNGDGIMDLLSVVRKSSYSSSDLWTIRYNQTASGGPYTGSLNSTFKDFVVVDADADGKSEILWRRRITSPPTAEVFDLYRFNGSSLALVQSQYLVFNNADANMTLYPSDFDGDGEIDYMALKPDKNLQAFSGFQPAAPGLNFNTPNLVQILDLNGDGKSDILVIKNSTSNIYSFNNLTGNWNTLYTSSTFPVSSDRIFSGDFNGDKKTDILFYRNGWGLKFSTGNSFSTSTIVPALRNYDPGASSTDNNYFIGDFNGDNKDDIAEMYAVGSSSKRVDVYYSKGDGTTVKESNLYPNIALNDNYFTVVDYNSDGQKDLFRYDYETTSTSYPTVSYFHKLERRDLINSIRNGLGFRNVIYFNNLNYRYNDGQNGWKYLLTRGTAETFPLQDFSNPAIVVEATSESNGIGSENISLYTYEGAKKHLQGKGFLGFMKQTTSSTNEQVKSITTFSLNRNFYFLRHSSTTNSVLEEIIINIEKAVVVDETKSVDYDLTLSINSSYDTLVSIGNKRIFVSPVRIYSRDANACQTTNTEIRYDGFGNPIFKRTKYSNSDGGQIHQTTIDTITYESFGNFGIDNRVIRESSTSIYAGEPSYTRITSYDYDSYGNLIKVITDPGKNGSVTKDLFLNALGLVDSVRISADSVSSRTTSYQYDQKFRFITREINPIGQIIDKMFDPGRGNMIRFTDINSKSTDYTYDGFGRNIAVLTPDGLQTSISYWWSGNDKYTVTTSKPGTPEKNVTYDILSRETNSSIRGQFSTINGYKTYNEKGQILNEQPPGGALESAYHYDNRGRIDSITYGSLKTYVEYPDGFSEIHYPDSTVKKIIRDGVGNIKNVFENGSEAIVYNYHSNGNIKAINSLGTVVSFGYDEYARRTSITNPNSGITLFNYDNLGQLATQRDAGNKVIKYFYDKIGRKTSSASDGDSTIYEYYTSGLNNGKIKSIINETGSVQSYRYDNLGRLIRLADSIPGEISMVTTYGYDSYNHNTSVTYPSGTTINYVYDNNNYGYLSEIWHGTDMLWKLNSSNSCGQPVNYNLGNISENLQVAFTYDYYKRLQSITTGGMKQTYSFDYASGNFLSRDYRVSGSPSGLTEQFEYDQLNRLIKAYVTGQDTIKMSYSTNGNITNKSDAGSYSYDQIKINAVLDITGNPGTVSERNQTIEYNGYNLTTYLKEESETDTSDYTISYNPLNQRVKTVFNPTVGPDIIKYYSGSYEKILAGGTSKERLYISSPFGPVALLVRQNDITTTYFIETDHLGSIIGLINPDKSYAEHFSFGPWGRRRNHSDWSYNNIPQPVLTDRGFTGHEHLDQFGLINMNGRMYDPVIARFLGVDPIIQVPDYSQSFNGYSYALNNPLRIIDPNGYTVYTIDPDNFAAFISSILSGSPVVDCIQEYSDGSAMTDWEYLEELKSYASYTGSDGSLWYNTWYENTAYTYMWFASYYHQVEHSAWIAMNGVFVLPIGKNTATHCEGSLTYYNYYPDNSDYWNDKKLPRWYFDGPGNVGKQEIIGFIHTHWLWTKEGEEYKDWMYSSDDKNFAYYKLTGIPVMVMGYSDQFSGVVYDFNQPYELDEIGGIKTHSLLNTFYGDNYKLIPKLKEIRLKLLSQ